MDDFHHAELAQLVVEAARVTKTPSPGASPGVWAALAALVWRGAEATDDDAGLAAADACARRVAPSLFARRERAALAALFDASPAATKRRGPFENAPRGEHSRPPKFRRPAVASQNVP